MPGAKAMSTSSSESGTPTSFRLPDLLRKRLVESAAKKERSLNAEVVKRLQASFGPSPSTIEKVFEALKLPQAIRMETSSTTSDCLRLVTVIEQLGAQSLLLGARANALNNAVLVVVIETPHIYCVMDTSRINIARTSRESEVQQLFQRFDSLGLLESAMGCTVLVPDTSELTAAAAAETIAREGKPQRLNLPGFLNLLAQTWEVDNTRPYRCES
jgi:hypothetical protein